MDYLFPYPKMGISFLEILEDPLTRKLLGHDAVHAEKIPFISGVTSRLTFMLNDVTKHLSFLKIGYSALEAFLQATATGPPLDFDSVGVVIPEIYRDEHLSALKQELLESLTVDGNAAYAITPRIELFWLAKVVMSNATLAEAGFNGRRARFRVNFWHQKLLSEKSDTLRDQLYADAEILDHQLGARLISKSAAAEEHYVEFLTERAAIRTFYGDGEDARKDLTQAATIRHFHFALTGALGKRTKFQDRDLSQLVVLAKSRDHEPETYSSRKSSRADSRKSSAAEQGMKSPMMRSKSPGAVLHRPVSPVSTMSHMSELDRPISPLVQRPHAMSPMVPATKPENLPLNDDTLLEHIAFKHTPYHAPKMTDTTDPSALPGDLASLDPTDQPLLFPMDSIILLSTASSISNTSPADGLTREETLPYATRVLEGGSSNWQVYTQALLVRSRIEGYRSRTMERGLLQLQALVDQVIVETGDADHVPSRNGEAGAESATPPTFLPKAKLSESASVAERLKYIYQISPPLRWELEAELAQRWTQLGGLRTALEIYRRLQMNAEVALCLAATEKEAEAVKLLRSLLFERPDDEGNDIDGGLIKPLPSDAPRLLSILGDILQEPKYYILAWSVSNQRYARAQRSLGQFYVRQKNPVKAVAAYSSALKLTRLDHATWFALGCVQLQLEDWPGAVESFTRVIQLDERDAESWSNLAMALLHLPPPTPLDQQAEGSSSKGQAADEEVEEVDSTSPSKKVDPYQHTYEALRALRRAATLKRDDARIWDNYLTVAASIPPSKGTPWVEVIQAFGRVIELRSKKEGEGAIDLKVLSVLVEYMMRAYDYPDGDDDNNAVEEEDDATTLAEAETEDEEGEAEGKEEEESRSPRQQTPESSSPPPETSTSSQTQQSIVVPVIKLPFIARSLLKLIDKEVVPLASTPPLFTLLSTLSLWRHRPAESLSYAEKAWRSTTTTSPTVYDTEAGWNRVVESTLTLAHAYRDLGDRERERSGGPVEKAWNFKAKSALRSVLGKGKTNWEGSQGYEKLEAELRSL